MTAAEERTEYQSDILVDETENSACLLSDKIPEIESDVFEKSANSITSNMDDEKNSLDIKDSEISGTNSTGKFDEDQVPPNKGSDDEALAKSADDEWLDITGSGVFKKKVIKPGLGEHTRPRRSDQVTADILYYLNDILFDEKRNFTFIVGDLDVEQGLDLVLCLMEKGETARVKIPNNLAFGYIGSPPNVPPYSDIECEIELKEVEPIDGNSLTVPERLKLGDVKRLRGNYYYDRGECIDSIQCYERAIYYLDGVRNCTDSTPEELQEVVNLRIKVYNNLAASHIKLAAYNAAYKAVENVLKVQPKNVKALYRKGKVLGLQGRIDDAIECLTLAASLEPETKAIQAELTKLKNKRNKEIEYQKAMYQRMFKNRRPKKTSNSISTFRKWSMISCGVLAVAIGSAVAFRQLHS